MAVSDVSTKSALLAQRASLGRIVALVANEHLVQVVFKSAEKKYYISPLPSASGTEQVKNERFVISGSAPFRAQHTEETGDILPALLHESNIQPGTYFFQQLVEDANVSPSWKSVNEHVTADSFLTVLRDWMNWDVKLTSVFQERIRCSVKYLADTYAENRPAPTRESDYITWEQSIVEANGHPLHKCRMPVDPRTQPTSGFDFKHADIAFLAVKRELLTIHGPLEAELASLLAAAGINAADAVDSSEIIIPVHEFQVRFLLSLPNGAGQLRLLPQKIGALAQSSTRTMSVPSVPGIGVKLSLSLIIGDNIRIINSRSAFNAVRYWTAGMLDPIRLLGLQGIPLELLPEVACANGLGDHLAVMIRWDTYHSSRGAVDADVGYAVSGALTEPAIIGSKGSVAESVFELSSLEGRLEFLRKYTQLYFQCFLKPLFYNGLLLDAHGQNSLLRFSRSSGQLLGFSARDMSGTRFNATHFERTTGIKVEERMLNHDMPVPDLLERAHFIYFIVHLAPLIVALDLHRQSSASFTSEDLLHDRASEKEASDLANGNGWAVIARELHNALRSYETLEGEDATSVSARELSAAARNIWMNEPTWPLQSFIAQRMRADWAHRDKSDKASTVPVPNIITA